MYKYVFSVGAVLCIGSTSVSANNIISDVGVAAGSDYTLTVTVADALTSSAVINWNGTALIGPFTLSNNDLSISATTTVTPCVEEGTITVTDGGKTC